MTVPRTILFDLYGTLLIYGDMPSAWQAWLDELLRMLSERGYQGSRRDLANLCDGFFEAEEPDAVDGLTIYEARLKRLADRVSIDLTTEDLTAMAGATVGAWQKYVPVDPEAPALLDGLAKSRRLGLVTNFDHPPHIRRTLDDTGLARCFDVVVVSSEVGYKKPDPEIIRLALGRLDADPSEAVMIGDSADDIIAARAAGVRAVLIQREDDRRGDGRDYRADGGGSVDERPSGAAETIASLRDLTALLTL